MIPLSRDEIQSFTPASLADIETPPVFRFRPATHRDVRAFQSACIVEGLRQHDLEDIRREQERALTALFSSEEAEAGIAQFRQLWDAADQGVTISDEDEAAANGLLDRLQRLHRPLRVMLADNMAFFRDMPRLALGLLLVGWRNIDLPFVRAEGVVAIETIDELAQRLTSIEAAALDSAPDHLPGTAWLELSAHAIELLNLTRGESGKSPSPSPSPSAPNGSTVTTPPMAATALAGEPMPKTRRRASPKPTVR